MESESVLTKQRRIAELAARHPDVSFTSLAYHVDAEWLAEAYRRTRKDAAAGVDEMTAQEYEEGLEARLANLLERFKSGTYFAPPVRRVYIPKDEKGIEKRPIGIPTLEDKVLQRAVVMLLEPLYEVDFSDSSYGFRRGRSPHQALEALRDAIMDMYGETVVLEIDIRKFFDTLKHSHLRDMLKRRVRDGVVIRMIGKWLNAGVMERGEVRYPEDGSPQGGVISPFLSNIYLHEVLDAWFEDEIVCRLSGKAKLVRFADDAVIVFENAADAARVRKVLPKRFAKYGLELHPDKTRLVAFHRSRKDRDFDGGLGKLNFLGFTHYWAKSRNGNWVVKRKTMKQRLNRSVKRVYQWCRLRRHEPIAEQWRGLRRKLFGHYQYFGITFNSYSVGRFEEAVRNAWQFWLNRRSTQADMPRDRFKLLLKRYPLPRPRIVHSFA